jgi:hypothetical protein
LRAVADTLKNAVARGDLLQLADGYDRLADNIEGLEVRRSAEVQRQ